MSLLLAVLLLAGIPDLVRDLGADDPEVREAASRELGKRGAEAKPALEEALGSQDAEVRYRARCLLDALGLGDREIPEAWQELAVRMEALPADRWLPMAQEGLRLLEQGDSTGAERELLAAMVLSRRLGQVGRQATAPACFTLAGLYRENRNWKAAAACSREGLSRDPWNGLENHRLALALDALGNRTEAEERFRAGLRLDPRHAEAAAARKRLGDSKPDPADETPPKLNGLQVYLLPFDAPSAQLADKAAPDLSRALGIEIRVLDARPLPDGPASPSPPQRLAGPILNAFGEFRPGDAHVLVGLTSTDIALPGTNFVFASSRDGSALVSSFRFDDSNLGKRANLTRLLRRVRLQLLTSIGRALGCPSCPDPGCAMAYPGSLDEFERKQTRICPDCRTFLEASSCLLQGKGPEAAKGFRERLERRPEDDEAWYRLGLSLESCDRPAAREALLHAAKIDPSDTRVQRALERLRE